jgi:hypothetical protein
MTPTHKLRYTQNSMRRSIAILLATVFSLLLMAPALISSSEATLPACCRQTGKHRCALRMAKASSSGPSFAAIAERCPNFPQSSSAVHRATVVPPVYQAIVAGIIRHPVICPQTEAGYRVSYFRSEQKRGPPHFSLS